MQHMKRVLVWAMLGALVLSLVPPGLARHASAAVATYFIPDINEIKTTATLQLTDSTDPTTYLSRSTVYTVNNGTLTIQGTFSHVSKDTMKIKIEQLNATTTGGWQADTVKVTNSSLPADTGSTNRFTANNISLFSGFNRITLSGLEGGVERADVFYVLFDRIPYLQALKINGGNVTTNLNEGSQVVVENSSVTLQGQAKNVSALTISVNGGSKMQGSILDDGSFFSPTLTLKPGLNTMSITIKNSSDSITISRSVYYFDTTKPFVDVTMTHLSSTYQLVNNRPTVTGGSSNAGNTASLKVSMLVKYIKGTNDFRDNTKFTINGGTAIDMTDPLSNYTEVVIPGTDGVTPAYRLVTFDTQSFTFQPDSNNSLLDDQDQSVKIITTYVPGGTGTPQIVPFDGIFKFLPGEVLIKEMYLLPNYNGTSDPTDPLASVTKLPLNNSEVGDDSFYIYVKTDTIPLDSTLVGNYLPLSSSTATISAGTAVGSAGTDFVYQVTNFAAGQQKVKFHILGSTSSFNANITYSSKDYIFVASIYDGQELEYNSDIPNQELAISGKYVGFKNLTTAQYFVNGVTPTTGGSDVDLEPAIDPTNLDFALSLDVGNNGPLVYGENRIVFVGQTLIAGVVRDVRKEIRIYIVDSNVSKITKFMPTLSPTDPANRQPFPSEDLQDGSYTPTVMGNIFSVSPEFIFKDSKYTTSQMKYDLVFQGSGASIVNVTLGGNLILNKTLPVNPGDLVTDTYTTPDNTIYTFDFAGDEKGFIIRIRDINFATPGTHVFNLELINGTGARASQRLEVVRELTAFRVLSPQASVGNQVIVNKNFVHFDIEAEGATNVLIGGKSSIKRPDIQNRFTYDFVGLKPDKTTTIKIQIVRPQGNINDTMIVYYASAIKVDSQYMQPISSKMVVFNKTVQLIFPKGTVLQSAKDNSVGVSKFYKDNQLLFGIADPKDGVVERRNDYGNIINKDADSRSTGAATTITVPDINVQRFNATDVTSKFTRISQIYWLNGGWGEEGDKDSPLYKPAMNGTAPYFIEGNQARAFADPTTPIPEERKIVPSNRGTLKISFNQNVVDDVATTITAFRFTDKGVWENVGGEVDMKAHTITVPFEEFGYYMVGKLKGGYADITNHPWARNILNGLYAKGIMGNARFDEFGADDQTSRGEFATLLVQGLNLPLNYDDNQSFTDVVVGAKTSTWDYEHIETAARAGIISGLTEGSFGADLKVTREEAAIMIARALKLKLATNDTKLEAVIAKAFVDATKVQLYARPSVQAVTKAGVMSGTPVTIPGQKKAQFNFNPKANLTRAEAGAITVKLLQKYTKIFPKNFS